MTPSTTNTAARELLACVRCGCPDELELDSSSAAEASWIECHDCQYRMQEKCDEETLVERWNKLDRRNMPAFVPPPDIPAREVSADERILRSTLDYWYARAKAAEAKLSVQTDTRAIYPYSDDIPPGSLNSPSLTQQQGGEQEALPEPTHLGGLYSVEVVEAVQQAAWRLGYNAALRREPAASEGDVAEKEFFSREFYEEAHAGKVAWPDGAYSPQANTSKQAAGEAVLLAVSESLCEMEVDARNAANASSLGGLDDVATVQRMFGRLADALEQRQIELSGLITEPRLPTTPPRHPADEGMSTFSVTITDGGWKGSLEEWQARRKPTIGEQLDAALQAGTP